MASKKNNKTGDITQTGYLTYKDLQAMNDQGQSGYSDAYLQLLQQERIGKLRSSTEWDDTLVQSDVLANSKGEDWFGKSKYDPQIATEQQFNDINDTRANSQGKLDVLGNAIVKMAGKAATTIAGTAGLVAGLGEVAASAFDGKGDGIQWSRIWDNEVFDVLDKIDKGLEDQFTIYATEAEQNADWWTWDYLTSAKFWGDSVITNIGFTLGAAMTGAGAAGILGKITKAVRGVGQLGKLENAAVQLSSSLVAASGEAAIEAKDAYKTFKEDREREMDMSNARYLTDIMTSLQESYMPLLQQAQEKYEREQGKTMIPDGEGNYVDAAYLEYQNTMSDLQARYQSDVAVADKEAKRRKAKAMENIETEAKSVGNKVMALDQALLTVGNMVQFGKAFSKSYSNAVGIESATNKFATKRGVKTNVSETIGKAEAKNAASGTGEKVALEGLESEVRKPFMGKTRAALKGFFVEGSEEMNEQWTSSGAIAYHKNQHEDVNDYWDDQYDKDANDFKFSEFASSIGQVANAIEQGFSDSWGDPRQYEQFLVGAMMGFAGAPTITKAGKSDTSKKWYNPSRWMSWEGGAYGGLRDYNREQKANKEANAALDTLLKDPKLQETMRKMATSANEQFILGKIQKAQDDAIESGDQKEYKDQEDKYFAHVINTFAKAGRMDDLKSIYSYYADMSDAEVENVVNETIKDSYVSAERDKANFTAQKTAEINELRKKTQEIQRNREEAIAQGDADNASVYETQLDDYARRIDDLDEEISNYQGQERYAPNLFVDEKGQRKPEYDTTEKVKAYLRKNGDSLMSKITDYEEGVELLNKQFNGMLTDDQEDNLLYLWMRNKGANKRIDSMFDELMESKVFPKRIRVSRAETYKDEKGNDKKIEHEDAKSLAKSIGLEENLVTEGKDGNFEISLSRLPKERAGATLARVFSSKENLKLFQDDVKDNMRNAKDVSETIDLMDNLTTFNDMMETYADSMRYYNTLAEYMRNPGKVEEKKAEAQEKVRKKEGKKKAESVKDTSTPDIVKQMEESDFDPGDLSGLEEEDAKATKDKVNKAKEIVDAKRSLHDRVDASGMSSSAKKAAHSMIDKSSETANDLDELMDMNGEAFFDSDAELDLTDEERGELEAIMAQDSDAGTQAIRDKKTQVEEEARAWLDEVFRNYQNDRAEMSGISSRELDDMEGVLNEATPGELDEAMGKGDVETGHDPTEKLSPVNGTKDQEKKSDVQQDTKDWQGQKGKESDQQVDTAGMSMNDQQDISANTKSATKQEVITIDSIINDLDFEKKELERRDDMPQGSAGQALYWKSNTTEEGIHNPVGDHTPYHEKKDSLGYKDPKHAQHQVIWEYLNRNGAFERMASGMVHKNSKVRIGFDASLNKETGALVPLMYVEDSENPGNWVLVGDMISNIDNHSQFPNYDAFLDRLSKTTVPEGENGVVLSDIHLTVNDVLKGRPRYSRPEERHILNEIASGQPFKLAVATKNPGVVIVDSRQVKAQRTATERKVKAPLTQSPGQPFILVGDDVNGYMCVPIRLPKFDYESASNTALGREALEVAKGLDNLDNMREGDILELKDGLQSLFNFTHLWIEKAKGSNWVISYKLPGSNNTVRLHYGPNTRNISTLTLQAFANGGVGWQVDVHRVNLIGPSADVDGMPYNKAIGELATTNLEIGGLTLVNNFPIMNFQDEKGNDVIATKPKGILESTNPEATSKAEKVIDILNNQEVGRPTPGDNTYTVNGKKYQRVHTVIGSNSTSAMSEQGKLNGARAVAAGTEIDSVVRQFFEGIDPRAIKYNQAIISNNAFNSLVEQLVPIRQYFASPNKSRKYERVYANNIVVAHDFNGVPVAGEIDILTVDDKGNFRIYDMKTSKNSFAEESYGKAKPYQKRSDREEHTNQLNLYADMLEKEYGVKVTDLTILPFNVKFQNGDKAISGKADPVIQITKVPSIRLSRDSAITDGVLAGYEARKSKENQQPEAEEQLTADQPTATRKETPKAEPSTPEGKAFVREEIVNELLDKGMFADIDENDMTAILGQLTDEQLQYIKDLSGRNLRKFSSDFINNISETSEKSIKEAFLKAQKAKKSEVTERDQGQERWNEESRQKELGKIAEMLPSLSQKDRVKIVDTIERVAGEGNPLAWGKYQDAVITLYRNAVRGTAYHEAFHHVMDKMLEDKEKSRMFAMGRREFGAMSLRDLEERLADGFKEYCVQREDASFGKRLMNFFRDLRHDIGIFHDAKDCLYASYGRIYRGKYAERQENAMNGESAIQEPRYSRAPYNDEAAEEVQRIKKGLTTRSEFAADPERYGVVHENTVEGTKREVVRPAHNWNGHLMLNKFTRWSSERGDFITDTRISEDLIGKYLDDHGVPRETWRLRDTKNGVEVIIDETALGEHFQRQIDEYEKYDRELERQYREEATRWENLSDDMRERLGRMGYNEFNWNMLSLEDREYAIKCC